MNWLLVQLTITLTGNERNIQEQNIMSVHLNISFETLVELVEQLPVQQKQDLLRRVQQQTQHDGKTVEEKMGILRAAQVDVAVKQEPSPRREDWYDDEGR